VEKFNRRYGLNKGTEDAEEDENAEE